MVLINYTDKSKSGTWKLGRVNSVEVDDDGLVRTCVVEYRLVRCDLPAEDLRIYFKGLKFKQIRVPVQRLSLILPVEEQIVNPAAAPVVLADVVGQLKSTTGLSEVNVGVDEKTDIGVISDEEVLGASFEVFEQVVARNFLVEKFKKGEREKKVQRTSRTVKYLHKTFSVFEALWKDCQVDGSAI